MLASLRAALAQSALGDDASGAPEIVAPLHERVAGLEDALAGAEGLLRQCGFEPGRLNGARAFVRTAALADAVEALNAAGADHPRQRFEILARAIFQRFKALVTEPTVQLYAERHDNIEAICKKLSQDRDDTDISELLKLLQRIVNEAIRADAPGEDQAQGLTVDLSQIDLERLRDEFARKVRRKATAIEDIRQLVERKLALMLGQNPSRMDFQLRYQAIVALYNLDKDRATVEATFAELLGLAQGLDEEQHRAAREGLTDGQLAIFDLLTRKSLTGAERERIKQASRELLARLQEILKPLDQWTEKEQTRAEVETFLLDQIHVLPDALYSPADKNEMSRLLFEHVWQQSLGGRLGGDGLGAR
jgi:type I restriction enzyme R subunit